MPRVGDADFTLDRLIARADDELANGLGNLVNRVVSMVHRYRAGRVPVTGAIPPDAADIEAACRRAPGLVAGALADFDFRQATSAAWTVVDEANRYVNHVRPWALARAEGAGDTSAAARLDAVLAALVQACRTLAVLLEPFLPDAAARVAGQCTDVDGRLPAASPLFRRIGPR